MQGPCPDGFFLPTYTRTSTLKTMLDTILGRTATGNDLTTYLFFPTQGYLGYSNGSAGQVGNYRTVRTCEKNSSGSYINGRTFGATSGTASVSTTGYNRRGTGYPIRPFKYNPAVPDSSWTTLYNASSVAPGAGIFHNASLELITVYDGTNYVTMADKNLGATTTDTSSTNSYGKFYQWGNNYGFPSSGFTTSSTRVDASSYGPGNYYYSSTFITTSSNNDWSTVVNDNLWGGVTKFLPCSELREAYIGSPFPYEPTSNTLAYFPFINDTQDKVGTATITAGVTPTKASVGFTFTSSSTGNIVTVNNANFWSIRAKANSLNSTYIGLLCARDGYVGYYYKHAESNLNKRFYIFYNSSLSRVYSNQTSIGTGVWHHICYGVNNGTWTFYVDGTQFYTQSTRQPYNTSGDIRMVGAGDGTDTFEISDLIVESVARTSTQVSNYYNATKSKYGIS